MTDFDIVDQFEELKNIIDPKERAQLIDYCNDIGKLAKEEIGVLFKNDGRMHAAIVMSTIFLHSTKTIKMFAGNFNGDVSGLSIWKKSLEKTFELNKDLTIEVILETKPAKGSIAIESLQALKRKAPNRVTILKLNDNYKQVYSNPLNAFHFTVGDENKFRIETNISTYKAACNFDDEVMSSKLLDMFSIMKSYTTELEA